MAHDNDIAAPVSISRSLVEGRTEAKLQFAHALDEAMINADMSRVSLAQILQVAPATIADWLHGGEPIARDLAALLELFPRLTVDAQRIDDLRAVQHVSATALAGPAFTEPQRRVLLFALVAATVRTGQMAAALGYTTAYVRRTLTGLRRAFGATEP